MNNVSRQDLEHHGRTLREYRRGVSHGLFGVGGRKRLHHRDLIGLKQPLDLDRVEPLPAVGKCCANDLPGGIDVGYKRAGHGRRHLRQRGDHLAVLHQMHEAAHRIVFGGVVGNPGAAEQIADLLVRADPNREHRLGKAAMLLAVLADRIGHGRGDVVGRSDRGLNIHHQDGIVAGVGQQHFKRRRITRRVGVANDIDRVGSRPRWRQDRIELLSRSRRDCSGGAPQLNQPIDREDTYAAAIGQDRQPLSWRRFDTPQRFGAVEQLAEIRHPQNSGATERGIVDRVRTGQRPGVGRGSLRALRHATGFDDHDGLDTCRCACRGHEFTGILDGFDIEQDRPGLAVHRVVIKQIGDVDVELVANRNNSGKPYPALGRPIHHAGGNGARLREQRQISRHRHVRRETCIEVCRRHHDAEAIGPDQPHAIFLRGAFGGVRQRPRAMAKPGGDDQSARRAQLSCLIDDASDGSGRRGNHHKFGYKWQFTKAADRGDAIDIGIMRIDESKLALESRLVNIVKNGPPDGASPRASPDQRE